MDEIFDAAGVYSNEGIYDDQVDETADVTTEAELAEDADIAGLPHDGELFGLQSEADALNLAPFEENAPNETEDVDPEDLDPQELVYDAMNGLDAYDHDGIDLNLNPNGLSEALSSFGEEQWGDMSEDERKDAVDGLADFVHDSIGLKNPPNVDFYNAEDEKDWGYFDSSTNTLAINEYNFDSPEEIAKTVGHELWHAHQHESADNPHTEKDYTYQIGFNKDIYIRPDEDFDGYSNQLVEAEAFAFEDQIVKGFDRLEGRA